MKKIQSPKYSPVEEYHNSILNSGFVRVNKRQSLVGYRADIMDMVKQTGEKPAHIEGIPLEWQELPEEISLGKAIAERRSKRNFQGLDISLAALGTVLMHALGTQVLQEDGVIRPWRPVAQCGGINSVEAYPIALAVESVPPGIYHFHSSAHVLAPLHQGNFRDYLNHHVFLQQEYAQAAAAIVLTSKVGKLQHKYGPRGYRLGCLDVGHVSQNMYLVAAALGLKICATNGFVDSELIRSLHLDDLEEAPFLVMIIGK